MNATQIKSLADKAIVDEYQGTITQLKRSNQTSKGPITTYATQDAQGQFLDVGIIGPQHQAHTPGTVLTVKSTPNGKGGMSGVVVNQYKGNNSLTCWDNAQVLLGATATQAPYDPPFESEPQAPAYTPPPQQAQQQPPQQPQQAFSTQMDISEMADIWTRARQTYRFKLQEAGLEGDALERAADYGPGLVSSYWFGKDRDKLSGL